LSCSDTMKYNNDKIAAATNAFLKLPMQNF
jgi:hypothetical protein